MRTPLKVFYLFQLVLLAITIFTSPGTVPSGMYVGICLVSGLLYIIAQTLLDISDKLQNK